MTYDRRSVYSYQVKYSLNVAKRNAFKVPLSIRWSVGHHWMTTARHLVHSPSSSSSMDDFEVATVVDVLIHRLTADEDEAASISKLVKCVVIDGESLENVCRDQPIDADGLTRFVSATQLAIDHAQRGFETATK